MLEEKKEEGNEPTERKKEQSLGIDETYESRIKNKNINENEDDEENGKLSETPEGTFFLFPFFSRESKYEIKGSKSSSIHEKKCYIAQLKKCDLLG